MEVIRRVSVSALVFFVAEYQHRVRQLAWNERFCLLWKWSVAWNMLDIEVKAAVSGIAL